MFGLKYLTLFVTRRRYAGYLWIALLALNIAVHNLGNGLAFVPDLLPLDQHAVLRLLLFSNFSILPLYTLVAYSLYPASHPRWLVRLVLIPLALVLLLTLFGPLAYAEFMSLALIPYLLLILVLLVRAAWQTVRRESRVALLLLATIILLTATAAHDLVGWHVGLVVSPHPLTFSLAFLILLLAVLFDQYDIDVFEKAQVLSRDLQRLVAERTRELAEKVATLETKEQELKTAYRDLETTSQSKSRFLAAASHDLRQPLHAMSLQTEILQEALHDEAAKTLVARIRNAQTSLSETLSALLDISRLDSGLLKPRLSHFPLQDLLTRLGDEFRPVAQERNVNLRLRPCPHWCYSDPVLLYRVVSNLMDNAIKHGAPCAVLVSTRRHQGSVSIEVRDTGPGIAPEKQDEIFKEFVQLDNSARNRDKGLGLGLSVVLRLSRLLNAPLALTSAPALGSCFTLSVPTGDPAQALCDDAKPQATFGYSLQGVVALVLDDDPAVREATGQLLTSWNCDTLVAADRNEALRVAVGKTIDVIVADYRFGGHDTGMDIIGALNHAAHRQHRAVIVTGEVNPEALAELRGGSYPVLTKPVAPITLRSALHRLLARSRQQDP
ncbi:MAG: hybrid sensor histidine kinase/response regulator [Candidatus Competibacteraceae bacterium]|nr:hybrid sensor histidine kinase/response regulator [Candidatus Competibacteraceae bacterium]